MLSLNDFILNINQSGIFWDNGFVTNNLTREKLSTEYQIVCDILTLTNKELILLEDEYKDYEGFNLIEFKYIIRRNIQNLPINSEDNKKLKYWLDNVRNLKYYLDIFNLNLCGYEYIRFLQLYLNIDTELFDKKCASVIDINDVIKVRKAFCSIYNNFANYNINCNTLMENHKIKSKKL